MDGALAQERVRAHWDRQPCDSELSARERGVAGRLVPPILRRALGRRWGWHRIVHARKGAPGASGATRLGARP